MTKDDLSCIRTTLARCEGALLAVKDFAPSSATTREIIADVRESMRRIDRHSSEPGAHLSAGWVSLGERKPANMELELVFDQTDEEVYLARFMMYDQNRYEFILGDGTVLDLHSVTHWMPLPEPPAKRRGT